MRSTPQTKKNGFYVLQLTLLLKNKSGLTKHCPQSIPKSIKIDLEHWGDSEFNKWISEPCFIGKYHYFFGELELDINWFKRQFKKQVASMGDKFNPSLHTETLADTCIHALLGDELFASQIYKWIEKLNEELEGLKKYIETLNGSVPDTIQPSWKKRHASNSMAIRILVKRGGVPPLVKNQFEFFFLFFFTIFILLVTAV